MACQLVIKQIKFIEILIFIVLVETNSIRNSVLMSSYDFHAHQFGCRKMSVEDDHVPSSSVSFRGWTDNVALDVDVWSNVLRREQSI